MTLSSGTRRTASTVAKIMLINALLLGTGFMVAGAGFLFFNLGHFSTSRERMLAGGVFCGLAVLALLAGWWAKKRVVKLKEVP